MLTASQLQHIFTSQIIPFKLGEPETEGAPTLYMVGAQPGAGKTKAIAIIGQRTGATEVNGDDLRVFHPDYYDILRRQPTKMPELTQPAVNTWVEMSLGYLMNRHADTIVETTFRHAQANIPTLKAFHDSGYRTKLVALAVPQALSLMGIITRYIGQVEETGNGRWTRPEAHDEAIRLIPQTLRQLAATGCVDNIDIVDRDGNILLTGQPSNGDTTKLIDNTLAEHSKLDAVTPEQALLFRTNLSKVESFLSSHSNQRALVKPVYERLQQAEQEMP
ncbi:zeta toxin family protein [Bifidobacterium sp. ESL0800]|uniref:zeta toxin family protein n=1 Tax=Bifidobacterium sp. ESL0800 TaxID=2983236 RepID=UPI0023F6F9F6|nr:zeta toxin family protein [Bifidobacterium sp. ESL0800]WEV75297.1 zeta toxin family protein [Bifidobacterium sp. ESL0800]